MQLAYDYFAEAALMDLDDLEHNTRDGVHIASLAGACIAALSGFGVGRYQGDGRLSFVPRLPEAIRRLRFKFQFQDRLIGVEVEQEQATYTLIEGDPFEIRHHGQRVKLGDGRAVVRPIPPAPVREPPSQPPGRAPLRRRAVR
jgi:alpha,alpha-trehalose phosphorylase